MNSPADNKPFIDAASNRHLDWLESESIHIMREVAAECSNPALLFSGGKDSVVLLRITPEVFSLVDYSKGFGHSDIVAFSDSDLDVHVASLAHRWDGPSP